MDVQRILKHSERRLHFFVDTGMPFADKAERLFQRLSDTSSYLEKKPTCAGHGDYTHNQVILSERAAVTFDWDDYEVADPCRDAARFVFCRERLALKELRSARGLGDASRIFLRTYLAGAPGVESHLPFYRAALCLQGARRDLVSHDLGRLERAEILLDRGLQVLES
jgi:aminoglycoside phosphotransferase (APT) family kinase protein